MGSFKQVFSKNEETDTLNMAMVGKMQVLTSSELQVSGIVGNVTSRKQKSSAVADEEVGIGGTCSWNLGGLDLSASVSVHFNIASASNTTSLPEGSQAYIQFLTTYQNSLGQKVVDPLSAFIHFVCG